MEKKIISKGGAKINPNNPKGIRASIRFPGINLDINTSDSLAVLKEIRRLVDSLQTIRYKAVEDEIFDEFHLEGDPYMCRLEGSISEDLKKHKDVMKFIKQAVRTENDFRYRKISLQNKKVLDIIKKESYSTVDFESASKSVKRLLFNINPKDVNFLVIHIASSLVKDDKEMILDLMNKPFESASVKTIITDKDVLGKTLVEAILFGNFNDEDM